MTSSLLPTGEPGPGSAFGRRGAAHSGWFAKWPRPTRLDIGFSALVGGLLAASPMTGSARLVPSLILGVVGGGVVFVSRMRRPRPERRTGFTLARPSWLAASVLALATIVFAPTAAWLAEQYTESIWRSGHGLFVPFFMILLARAALRRDASPDQEASAWGFAFLLPALVLVLFDVGIRSRYLAALGLAPALPGLSLLLLGARRTRSIAVPLALGVFLIPLPTWIQDYLGLSRATAEVARPILAWFGAPGIWYEANLRLPHTVLAISHNCSAFSALHAGVAFAAMLAATGATWWRRILPLLVVFPAAAIANGVRLVALALATLELQSDVLDTPLHGLSGIAVYAVVLVSVWLVGDRRGLREALA